MPPRKRPKRQAQVLAEEGAQVDENGAPLPTVLRAMHDDKGQSTFFGAQTGCTSTKTVAELGLDDVTPDMVDDAVRKMPVRNEAAKKVLFTKHTMLFPRIWHQLRAGHSALLYGFGSKREVVRAFARDWTSDGACMSVDGLEPSLTATQVLVWAAALARGSKPSLYRSYSAEDLLELLARPGGTRVYVLIDNIEGPGLRDPASQRLLSRAARARHVHLLATVDHVNAALIWDLQSRDRFAWVWHHTPTFASYRTEVALAAPPALLAGRREAGRQRGALVVLSSLSQNARHVFRVMGTEQLTPGGEEGIAFDRLFQLCREKFLVSNESLLSSFLTEFRDHELVKIRRTGDGQDVLHLSFSPQPLQQLLDDLEAL